jgi:hypothetical protein
LAKVTHAKSFSEKKTTIGSKEVHLPTVEKLSRERNIYYIIYYIYYKII